MDYYLRTANEDAMLDALIAAGVAHEVTDVDGEVLVIPEIGVSIDNVGQIPAVVDDEGFVVVPGDSRWHTNIRVAFVLDKSQENLLPVVSPTPTMPYRIFI